ncbi:hypothetical protein [Hymenobacter elongatus]|uniref:hypothetical protein n=1 Tax=Hymenobacter elongatus TaxID=877208 RepID=UPI001AEBC1DA|nr:hypothetical protein [Hymenobacter elongatus]
MPEANQAGYPRLETGLELVGSEFKQLPTLLTADIQPFLVVAAPEIYWLIAGQKKSSETRFGAFTEYRYFNWLGKWYQGQ